ncbi:MAG TPA: hypothetical protein VIV66_09465 [Pyrinomonadaceae bacterium]
MPIRFISRRLCVLAILTVALHAILCPPLLAKTATSTNSAAELLGDSIGAFRATAPATSFSNASDNSTQTPEVPAFSSASRGYTSPVGDRLIVRLISTSSESEAYALLTRERDLIEAKGQTAGIGSFSGAGFLFPGRTLLAKGKVFVEIEILGSKARPQALLDFSSALAVTLPEGESEVPVLVKHLPDWEKAAGRATYFVSGEALRAWIRSPTMDSIDFDGAESVAASYDAGQMVIIEFQTPQLATENDQRIRNRIIELRGQSVLLPTVYRRVGNYGVFVFNGSSEQAANQLIDQVKYEQITKWLGDSPYPLLEAQRAYRESTLRMLVSVVKASGLAIVVCFSVGGLIGGLLFIRRRAQQKSVHAYSDAGGMLRLNLDEMTPQNNPARLLGPGN